MAASREFTLCGGGEGGEGKRDALGGKARGGGHQFPGSPLMRPLLGKAWGGIKQSPEAGHCGDYCDLPLPSSAAHLPSGCSVRHGLRQLGPAQYAMADNTASSRSTSFRTIGDTAAWLYLRGRGGAHAALIGDTVHALPG